MVTFNGINTFEILYFLLILSRNINKSDETLRKKSKIILGTSYHKSRFVFGNVLLQPDVIES